MDTEKRIQLPPTFDTSSMLSFFENVIDEQKNPTHPTIIFDFSTLKYIKPTGVTALANITTLLMTKGCKVLYSWPDNVSHTDKRCPIKYLDDAGYFRIFLNRTLSPSPRCRSTTFPLYFIKYASYPGWLENHVIPWLDTCLSINTKNQLPEFIVCVQEIFNNIIDHSTVDDASVFMQHYPANKVVEIAISDFGVGIPANVRKIHPDVSDHLAIEHAVVEGFSTKSQPSNRGAGLDTLIQNVVKK